MTSFSYEFELVEPVISYLKDKAFSVCREIRIGFCRADIVAYDSRTVIAVELKLRDWKKALIQARNYQLGAEYVYVAFPLEKSYYVLKKVKSELEREGIGLLGVNDEQQVLQVIDAKKSQKTFGVLQESEIQKQQRLRYRQSLLRSF
jgi:hypothetical protein